MELALATRPSLTISRKNADDWVHWVVIYYSCLLRPNRVPHVSHINDGYRYSDRNPQLSSASKLNSG
ncbi:hypothetical protein, partial [Nostoc sp.]|uniref:hypothetical protein n=1 Tax=Nostoc sp. TaxID=1180 RepID=UPI0035940DCF